MKPEVSQQAQFKQLELFFEECRQQREERAEGRRLVQQPRKQEPVELVPWPANMRFD
jgi:hypothetical protein